MSLLAGTRLGPYEIVAPIGAGGMGEVYRATDTKLKRQVAIKMLPASVAGDADRLARFQREAEVLAAVNHPNIAAIHGLEESAGVNALVMELVEGEDLSQRIARGAIPIDDALPIAKQIAEALEAAHEQGIVHRDLKPANVKVRPDGTVKVLDFGLAKAMDPAATSSTSMSMSPTITTPAMTQAGMILGTAAYMSPEQARGKAVDQRADIWAFGVVLYEMLTGQRAFDGDDISITLASVLKTDVNWDALPAALPLPLQRLLRRCLDKDPRRRLQAIGEARIAIDTSIAGAGLEADAASTTAPRQPTGRAWKIAAGVLAATAIGLGVVAVRHALEQAPARQLVRFQIPAPEGSDANAPVMSPDGRLVAFRAFEQFWVHSLESSTSYALTGTDGATGSQPFWSPDSRYLAFRAGNKLQKVAVGGGRPQPIADLSANFIGGSWGSEGVIVFGTDQGLMQVPEAGGTPAVLVPRDSSRKDVLVAWPKFLPDGRHFVYSQSTATGTQAQQVEFYLGSLDRAQTPTRLMDAQGSPVPLGYTGSSNPGVVYLLFARRGALMVQAIDTRSLAISGEAMRVDADLEAEGQPWASISTTGVLAYQSAPAPRKFQLTWFDRSGKTLGVESLAGNLQAPSLSRDGKRVAIERRDSGNADIWVLDVSRGTTTRVTTDPGDDIRPVLSPDGTRVAFARARSIYLKSASGAGDEERLGDGETMDWSPDGRFISFLSGGGDLLALPLSGDRTPILIAGGKGIERRGRFSPDGKWVAFESNVSGRYEIYLQSFPPTTDALQIVSVDGGDSAHWRGDGRELFFRAMDNRIMAVDIKPGPRPEPSVPRALFQLTADVNNGRFAATPDGQRFLVPLELQRQPRPQIMITLNWLEALENRSATGK